MLAGSRTISKIVGDIRASVFSRLKLHAAQPVISFGCSRGKYSVVRDA